MNHETFTCGNCEEITSVADKQQFDGQYLCPTCFDGATVICGHCGSRIWMRHEVGDTNIALCRSCYDSHYTNCDRCGRIIHNDSVYYTSDDDDDPLCLSCYEDSDDKGGSIADYSYKPSPIFYGEGTRYMGVELEIDGAGELAVKAQKILDIANEQGVLIYCKHDGSLDDGFEIVTHPMTLPYHQDTMPWAAIMGKAVSMGYRSHRARTCGLHVHVNRSTFGTMEQEQETVIARILYFVEKHWEELLKFSRRTQSQLEHWAARYGYKEQPREILDHAKKGYGGGRYSCINLQNYDTIEFRIFRGTLKHNTLIATLQMVNHICDVAVSLSDEGIKNLSWTTFVTGIQESVYPELVRYLKERRLYVNEPMETEEDA